MKLKQVFTAAVALIVLSGCGQNQGNTMEQRRYDSPVKIQSNDPVRNRTNAPVGNQSNDPVRNRSNAPFKIQSNEQSPAGLTEGRHIVPVREIQNAAYVSLDDLAQATGFNGKWLWDGTYGVGDNDANWVFRIGESKVSVAGDTVTMPSSAIKEGDKLYVPVSSLEKLFGDVSVFTVESNNVAFFPKPTPEDTGANGQNQDFADAEPVEPAFSAQAAASSSSTGQSMIKFAKRFMGVKYDFGAGPYNRTKRFDCSSFTRYVYDQFDIDLPRVARQQANKGKYVARNKLKVGDLLFFYVPGRFKSSKVVGHVGIYMGNGNMIHSSPKPKNGVQITPINKPYWKDTYLYSRRYF